MSGTVDYDHADNRHTLKGAAAALSTLLGDLRPKSLLDVGCGTGTWLRAARDLGIEDTCGIDGIALPAKALHVPPEIIRIRDLRGEWGLERRFDLALCMEVAEHLPPSDGPALVRRLTACSDQIYFSAANVWQGGQGHLNGQWPAYWQGLFNENGFACRDTLRWRIWDDDRIEPWYRQNIFLAEKNQNEAGREPRIPGVIHPDCMRAACEYWRCRHQSLLEGSVRWLACGVRRILGSERNGIL